MGKNAGNTKITKIVRGICVCSILFCACICICFFVFYGARDKTKGEKQVVPSFTRDTSQIQQESAPFEEWMNTQGYAEYTSFIDTAPAILNKFSVYTEEETLLPASPWVLSQKTKNWVLAEDIPGEYPNVRIEAGMCVSSQPEKNSFHIIAFDSDYKFPRTPQSMKSTVYYHPDTGISVLSVTYTWQSDEGELGTIQKWRDILQGFTPQVLYGGVSSKTGLRSHDMEYFFHHPQGGKALIKNDSDKGKVTYVDVTFMSQGNNDVQQYFKQPVYAPLPSCIPGHRILGDWRWKEKNSIRKDFVKCSQYVGMDALHSLVQWVSQSCGCDNSQDMGKMNQALVYGLAHTWNGYLEELTLWFNKDSWDSVRPLIFRWFDMEQFNFSEIQEPVHKDGLDMYVRNVDEKVVAVTICDTEIAHLKRVVHNYNGTARILEIRKSLLKK